MRVRVSQRHSTELTIAEMTSPLGFTHPSPF